MSVRCRLLLGLLVIGAVGSFADAGTRAPVGAALTRQRASVEWLVDQLINGGADEALLNELTGYDDFGAPDVEAVRPQRSGRCFPALAQPWHARVSRLRGLLDPGYERRFVGLPLLAQILDAFRAELRAGEAHGVSGLAG